MGAALSLPSRAKIFAFFPELGISALQALRKPYESGKRKLSFQKLEEILNKFEFRPYLCSSRLVEQYVFELQVPVANIVLVAVVDGGSDLPVYIQ